MDKRIGWPAGIIAFVSASILAAFEVQQMKMPDTIFVVLVAVLVGTGTMAFIFLFHGIYVWVKPVLKRYSFGVSIYRRGKPNPLQWLIDIAEKQKDNPTTHLIVRDRIYFEFKRDALCPYLWVRIFYSNLGLHDLLISKPRGFVYYGGAQLPNKIEFDEGQSNVSANGGNGEFDFKIYIPKELVETVSRETDSETGEVRRLELHHISAKVYIKGDNTRFVKWTPGGDRVIFRPNR